MASAAGNGPLALHIDVKIPLSHVESIIFNALSKLICFLPVISQSKSLKCSVNVAMMAANLVLPPQHFKGFRPANCQQKAYLHDQGIVPHP